MKNGYKTNRIKVRVKKPTVGNAKMVEVSFGKKVGGGASKAMKTRKQRMKEELDFMNRD